MYHSSVGLLFAAHRTDNKDRVAVSCNFGHSCSVSFGCHFGYSYNVTVMPLRYPCVTNFLSNTVNYYTDILNVLNATY